MCVLVQCGDTRAVPSPCQCVLHLRRRSVVDAMRRQPRHTHTHQAHSRLVAGREPAHRPLARARPIHIKIVNAFACDFIAVHRIALFILRARSAQRCIELCACACSRQMRSKRRRRRRRRRRGRESSSPASSSYRSSPASQTHSPRRTRERGRRVIGRLASLNIANEAVNTPRRTQRPPSPNARSLSSRAWARDPHDDDDDADDEFTPQCHR